MDINHASLVTLFRTLNTSFSKGMAWRPEVDLSFLFTEIPSGSASNVRRMTGGRLPTSLCAGSTTESVP